MKPLTFGSLFAGIGGFDLGLERAGMECRWQVEIDDYCQKVLTKHWPHVPKFRDVRGVGSHNLESVDLICGGFPCQDISYAGKGAGLSGERSGLFYELIRVVRQMGPRFVLLENVAALLTRGLDQVLGTLASLGFDAEWHCIPAASVGAPHSRERVFILAYPAVIGSTSSPVASKPREAKGERPTVNGVSSLSREVWRDADARVLRVVDGLPDGLDRIKGLGNAVVPQVAEWIGRKIVEAAT